MHRKTLLRIILVLLGIWIVLLIIFYFSGSTSKDHALKLLQRQLDNRLSTEIQLPRQGIHFSILRNFPYASLRLNHILIKSSPRMNQGDFNYQGADTLLYADEISLLFNLKSLISKKYELKKIVVSRGILNLLADQSGTVNYKIIKPSPETEDSDSISIQLKNIYLNDTEIHYIDAGQNLHFSDFITESEISGEIIEKDFRVQLRASLQNTQLDLESKNYLNEKAPAKINIVIERSGNNFSFEKGEVTIMGMSLTVAGAYDLDKNSYDFTAASKAASLDKISFAAWVDYFRENKIRIEDGDVDLKVFINGYVHGKGPTVRADFRIYKGELKSQTKQIQVKNMIFLGHFIRDNNGISTLNIDSISLQSDKSLISGSCSIRNLTHPYIVGKISGVLELHKLMIFEPVARRFELRGTVKGELIMNGSVSTANNRLQKDLLNAFKSGELELQDCFIRPLMNPFPAGNVSGIIKLKGLKDVWFENLSLTTGNSDLLIDGSVTNLPLFSNSKTVFPVYRCAIRSNRFHVEDFLLVNKQEDVVNTHTVQLPDSMIVFANIKIGEFYFGKFSASEGEGSIHYEPKVLTISDFSMKSQDGEIFSDISISQQGNRLVTKSTASFRKVDLGSMFYAFNNFGQHVISSENLDGSLSGTAAVEADWDLYLEPLLTNLKLQSFISIENGELVDYQPLLGLSKFIEVEELRHIKFDRLETRISIDNEIVYIAETNIKSSAISLIASGEHDFENRYRYYMQVQLSDILWNKAKKKKPENTEFGYVVDDGLGRTTIPLVIEGKDTDFEVFYDRKKGGSVFRTKMKEEKEELKKLIKSDENTEGAVREEDIRLEWEEDLPESRQDKKEDESREEKEKEGDFTIEWDDE